MRLKPQHKYIYASVTDAEYLAVSARAKFEGLSMSNYLRRCINAVALEEGDEAILVEERTSGRRSLRRVDESD